jgi:hypothetical protein
VVGDPNSFEETNLAQMLADSIYDSMRDGWLPSSYLAAADQVRAGGTDEGGCRWVCPRCLRSVILCQIGLIH